MKKIFTLFLSLSVIFTLTACSSQDSGNNTVDNPSGSESPVAATETPSEALPEASTEASTEGKTLVVYYSATGNTEEVANYIVSVTGADLFELVPVDAYSDGDLNYSDDNSRVVYEHDNPDARAVELVESIAPDWESYDTVFIGYVDGIIGLNSEKPSKHKGLH